MQPLASGPVLLPMFIPPPPSHPPPPIPNHPSTGIAMVVKDCPSDKSMTWKRRGEYHLGRREFAPAAEAFGKVLQDAEKEGNNVLIGKSLEYLGLVYLEEEKWAFAAKFFNSAYAMLSKNEQTCHATLALMAEVERRYLEKSFKIRQVIDPNVYLERRLRLRALRQDAQVMIQKETSVQTLQDFTQGISRLLVDILKNGFALFGVPPCEYSMIGLGSLARKEMSPYSDLEFALLVEQSSKDNLDYFRKMVLWLEIQVIHLGETEFKILDSGRISPVMRGFSFDDGGNTPLGKQEYVELIKTPEELATFQLDRFYQEDLILSNVLRGAENVVGSEPLYQRYLKAIQAILNAKSSKPLLNIAQARAIDLLQGHLVQFEPCLDKKKEEAPIYNIKAELYRLPSFLIAGLADYFGIEEQNTWKRLNALVKANILSEEGAKQLQDAMTAIMRLRIRCHLHYGEECEKVYHPSMQLKGNMPQNVFLLSDEDIHQIIEIYRVIFPLHRLFKQVCQTRDFASLSKESFYDTSPLTQGEAYEKLHQYTEAKKSYQQAVALSPDNVEGLIKSAHLHWILAEYVQAKEYAGKAYALGKRQNDEKILSRALNVQGLICDQLGETNKAIGYFEEELHIYKKSHGDEHPSVAKCLNNLGNGWRALGDAKKAVCYLEKALHIGQKIYGDFHPDVALYFNNTGLAWLDLGDAKKAVGFLEKALGIGKKVYGEEHPEVAKFLSNLGTARKDLGETKKALDYYEQALRISKKIYALEHPLVALYLNNIGNAWLDLGEAKKAISFHEEALRIGKKMYGDNHLQVAKNLNNLGAAWRSLGKPKKAIDYYEQALSIIKKIYGDEHSEVASYYNNTGHAWLDLGDAKKAMGYFEETLRIDKNVNGDQHPLVAMSLNNVAQVWLALGETKKAISLYDEAMCISKKAYGDKHPHVAASLNNLGNAWRALGNAKKAVEYHEASLHIRKKVYGHEHPELAICLHNLGHAWHELGNTKKAIGYLEEALRIAKKAYGNEHPTTTAILNNLQRIR
ncbi:MAG: tetratricopeptide repeat protein [Parachlamydia sp.]|nr:tetratricopeptide repeat protein [Parachlamydia sp.]